MKTELKKFEVCEDCHCIGIQHTDCKCSYTNYKTIELEFEVCSCCGTVLEDGDPADTEFNKKQLKQ